MKSIVSLGVVLIIMALLLIMANEASAAECKYTFKRFGREYCVTRTNIRRGEFNKAEQRSGVTVRKVLKSQRKAPRLRSNFQLSKHYRPPKPTLSRKPSTRALKRAARESYRKYEENAHRYPTINYSFSNQ